MTNLKNIAIYIGLVTLGMGLSGNALAIPDITTIDDSIQGSNTYWGSDDHGHGDVISSSTHVDDFNIRSVDVYYDTDGVYGNGNPLVVDIYTGFAGQGGDLYDSYTTGSTGIGYGDLFLGTTWTPHVELTLNPLDLPNDPGFVHASKDDNSNGTRWEYVFSLDDVHSMFDETNNARYKSGYFSASGNLYSLDGTPTTNNANPEALTSNAFINSNVTFRGGQEVAVDVYGDGSGSGVPPVTQVGTGTWTVSTNLIRFVIDVSGTPDLTYNDGPDADTFSDNPIALHWAMTCANDTVEGKVKNSSNIPLPEPATTALLGLGLAGLGFARRRRTERA